MPSLIDLVRASVWRQPSTEVPPASGDGVLPDAEQRKILMADLVEKGVAFDNSMPTDELRALSVPLGQPAPAKRGRKPAQTQE